MISEKKLISCVNGCLYFVTYSNKSIEELGHSFWVSKMIQIELSEKEDFPVVLVIAK